MTLLRSTRRSAPRAVESSPLASRNHGIDRQERAGSGSANHKLATKMAQFLNEYLQANGPTETFSEIEVPATPQPTRVGPRPRTSPVRPPHHARHSNFTSRSSHVFETPVTRSVSARAGAVSSPNNRSTNTQVEIRVRVPGRAEERRIVEDTVFHSSPPQPQPATSPIPRSDDSGFFSPTHDNNSTGPNSNTRPSMHMLHLDHSYDPETQYTKSLSPISRLRREVKLSRDPRIRPGKATTRCNIGEGSALEHMLFSEIAARLFRHADWRWAFYYLLHHELYDETTCITSIMRRDLESAPPAYRRGDSSHACEHCIANELLCVRLFVDEKAEKRFSVATLPRELKLVRANEKNLGYYVLESGARG